MPTTDPLSDDDMVQYVQVAVLHEDGVRRMIAKALARAVKEATGRIKVSGKRMEAAQRFIASESAFVWACYLDQEENLAQLCTDLGLEPETPEWRGGKEVRER